MKAAIVYTASHCSVMAYHMRSSRLSLTDIFFAMLSERNRRARRGGSLFFTARTGRNRWRSARDWPLSTSSPGRLISPRRRRCVVYTHLIGHSVPPVSVPLPLTLASLSFFRCFVYLEKFQRCAGAARPCARSCASTLVAWHSG